jgi:hypothetical protein
MLGELEKNEQRDIKVGMKMFRLVLFACRSLRVQEIHHALAIPDAIDTEYSPSEESFEDALIQGFLKRIIHCGGNFLEIQGTHNSLINPFTIVWLTYIQEMSFNLCIKLFSRSSPRQMEQQRSLRSSISALLKMLMLDYL